MTLGLNESFPLLQTYSFDFLKMEQKNTRTNWIRKIERVQVAPPPIPECHVLLPLPIPYPDSSYEDAVIAGPITLLFEGERNSVAKAIRSLNDHFDSCCIKKVKHAPIKLKHIIRELMAEEAAKRGLKLQMEPINGTCGMTCEGGSWAAGRIYAGRGGHINTITMYASDKTAWVSVLRTNIKVKS